MNFEEKIRNLFSEFIHPSQAVGMIPKWFWNRPLSQMTREYMKTFLLNLRDKDGYQGVMPVPEPKMEGYLGEEYLERFHECMDILQELGMYAILWDECGFPSGRADGRLEESYPEHTAKYLQMHEWDFTGPFHQTVTLPNSPIMSVVLMNTQTLERKDCTKLAANGKLSVSADSSAWKLMAFTLERNPVVGLHGGKGRFVDYLNRDAVRAYISVNQQVYYDAMPQHFGTTIRYEFYDESSFGIRRVDGSGQDPSITNLKGNTDFLLVPYILPCGMTLVMKRLMHAIFFFSCVQSFMLKIILEHWLNGVKIMDYSSLAIRIRRKWYALYPSRGI